MKIFEILIGRWQGTGKGDLPDHAPFNYSTSMDFSKHKDMLGVVKYEEVAYVKMESQYQFKHSEVGYLIFGEREVQWCIVHNNGRMEHLTALAPAGCTGKPFKTIFDSIWIRNHSALLHVQSSRRELLVDLASMQYNQYMSIGIGPLVKHLSIDLHRFKPDY